MSLNQFFKSLAFWLLVILFGAMFYSGQMKKAKPQSDWDYSKFISQVESGNVKEVKIHPEDRTALGTAKDDSNFKVVIPDDPNQNMIKTLLGQNVNVSVEPPKNNFIWALLIQLGPIVLIFGWFFYMMRQAQSGSGGAMAFGKSRARLLTSGQQKFTFADVAGVDEAKTELVEVVDFLKDPKKYQQLGGKIPKGVILLGPPGTGKTLLAKAVAGEAGVPFFSISGSDFVEMFVGVGAARVRDLFEQGKKHAPCIIFIDEIDAVGRHRGAGLGGGHDEREQTLNAMLVEMDGFNTNTGVILIAATNRMDILDPALLRPGRFDRQIVVDRPDMIGREAILRVHAKTVKLAEGADLAVIARRTPGFSGADLANLINEAALLAARRNKESVGTAELNEAIERTIAGLEKKNRLMNVREKEIVAHHESGHALLAEILPTTDRVHKVSMIPRGLGALGYTMQLPLEDRYLMTRPELLDKITVLMGGRAAERVVFNEVSTGATDDLQRATDLARRMVAQFGMSSVLGPQSVDSLTAPTDGRFMPGVQMGERGHSERTQQLIDQEVSELLRRAFERAVALLEHNRTQLLALAARLREKEMIEGEELREALEGAEAPPTLQGPDELQWAQLRH
jgi:cell division protease FtsH